MRAIVDEVLKFEMPGAGIPGFMRKAADIAKAGIYDLRVHRYEVLLPIIRHWGIFELTGLDGAAEEARRRLAEHLEKLDAAARRFEDRMARATPPAERRDRLVVAGVPRPRPSLRHRVVGEEQAGRVVPGLGAPQPFERLRREDRAGSIRDSAKLR